MQKKRNQFKTQTQITKQILAESKLKSENNYQLLKNLVGAKVAKTFVFRLYGTENPTKEQKACQKTKDEFHNMFFNPVKISETEHQVKGIAESIIKKFDTLSKTFIKPDEQFVKELTNHVRDSLSRFLSNQHDDNTSK